MKAITGHNLKVGKALPRLIFDISIIFVAVQAGLAALNVIAHFIATHIKH